MGSRTYYMSAVIKIARGGVELRRFHADLDFDPRCLPADKQQRFIAEFIHGLGIHPKKIANFGSEPPVVVAIFDTEKECRDAYAEAVELANAKPSVSKSDIDTMNAAAMKRVRKAKGRAAN